MRAALVPALALAIATGGCVEAMSATDMRRTAPAMDPIAFFAGQTSSWGVIETPGGRPSRTIHVEGVGAMQPDGRFRLDQTVRFGDGKVERRHWMMHRTGPDRYAATLSDAAGPVTGEAMGNALHLRFRLKGPAVMNQWLYLQEDGRTVMNIATVSIAGMTIARIAERISKVDQAPADH